MARGIFLVLEGIEGSGKTTQAKRLAEWLRGRGVACVATREPGGTAVGEVVRRLLLEGDALDDRTELLLLLSARAALVHEVIEPALGRGEVVIADRFELSTLAYQAYGRGLDDRLVREMNRFATGGLRPHLTLLLDVPRDVGERRRAVRPADRIEGAGTGFHERVAAAYRELAVTETGVIVVDGTGPPDAVQAALLAALANAFPETFA